MSTSQNANFSYPTSTEIYDINPLWTAPSTDWVWTTFAYGSSQIYLGGYVNGFDPAIQGAVYRTTIDSNGIDLTVPVLALPLEGGEYPTALGSYLNLVFVGTNLGLRLCQTLAAYDPTGNQGDLRSGPLIPDIIQPVTSPITGIVGNGRFVWFTWNDFDSESTGLGRCDLSHFIDNLAPAYASDLMVDGAGVIALDWCTITDSPVMGVPNQGLYVSDPDNLVPTGTLDSGYITYGIPDNKIAMSLSYRTDGQGGVEGQVSVDTGGFGTYGVTVPGEAVTMWPLPQLTGEYFEIRTTLFPEPDGNTPVLARWLMSSIAAVTAGIEISAWSCSCSRPSKSLASKQPGQRVPGISLFGDPAAHPAADLLRGGTVLGPVRHRLAGLAPPRRGRFDHRPGLPQRFGLLFESQLLMFKSVRCRLLLVVRDTDVSLMTPWTRLQVMHPRLTTPSAYDADGSVLRRELMTPLTVGLFGS